MAVNSRHNIYTSIPDWFSQSNSKTATPTSQLTVKQVIYTGGQSVSTSSGISEINLFNKFVIVETQLDITILTNINTAIVAIDTNEEKVGKLVTAEGWATSDYLAIAAGTLLHITATAHNNYGVVFYDNTQTVIQGNTVDPLGSELTVPANARYFRVCSTADDETFSLIYNTSENYSKEQLLVSDSNILDYTQLNPSIPEGIESINFNNNTLKLLVQKPLLLNKDVNNVIKLSLDGEAASIGGTFWEIKVDENTKLEYIFTKYPVATQYGITMYTDEGNLVLPDIYAGLPHDNTIIRKTDGTFGIPIDNSTIVINNGKLTALGGTGSNVATEVAWTSVKGKPTWLEDDKVSYTEVEGLADQLKKYVTIAGNEDVTGVHPFVNGLKVGSLLINQLLDDVVYIDGHLAVKGGIAMYVDNGAIDLPNLYDGFPTDGTIIKNENGSFGIPIDNSTIVLNNGKLTVVGGTDESGGLDDVNVTGEGNAITSASLSNNILTLTKGATFLDQLSGDSRYLLTSEYKNDCTAWGQTYWDKGKPASVKGDLIDVGNIKFETAGKNIGEWGKGAELTFSNAVISKGSGQSLWLVSSSYLDTNGIVFGRNDEGSRSEEIARINSIGLYPYNSNSLTLGTSSKLWKHVYTSEVTVDDINIKKSASGILYIDANLVVKGGVTMYATDATSSPSIIDSLPIANTLGTKGIATFDATYFKVTDGKVTLVDDLALDEYVTSLSTLDNYLTYTKNGVVNKVTVPYATTANKLSAARAISLTGHATGSGSFDGSTDLGINVTIPTRNVYINGVPYTVHSTITTDTTGIYAPTSGGTSGFVLKANGATSVPTWIALASLSVGYATKPYINNSSNNGIFPIIFTNIARCGTPDYDSLYVDTASGSGYNPSTNTFYATTFSGALSGNATSASKLTTLSKTAWGRTYWTDGGVPTSIDGDILNVGHIKMKDNNSYDIGTSSVGVRYIYANWIGAISGDKFSIGANNGTALTILTDQKIGIGTKNPTTTLQVDQSEWANGITINRTASGGGGAIAVRSNGTHIGNFGINGSKQLEFNVVSGGTAQIKMTVDSSGNGLFYGGVTMYSDLRKKTILNHVELSLKEVADAPLIEHYYNSDDKKTTHVGSIAQYWAGLNDWFCKKDDEGFLTMEIQNAALASAISVARELSRYESETDKRIRLLEEENHILKNEIENLRKNK